MVRVVISQPMYLPWVGFLAQLSLADCLIWLDDARFSKGSFTNRVQVPGTNDATSWLSIPLEKPGTQTEIRDLRAARPDWLDRHLSTARNAWKTAPHRDEALACIGGLDGAGSLCDTIIESSESLARAVGLRLPRAAKSSALTVAGGGSGRVLDMVRAVGGTSYLTGMGARNYLDHAAFEAAGIAVDYMDYDPRPWPQGWRSGFTPYVSALDLVAHVAPGGRVGHLNPRTRPWRAVMADQDRDGDQDPGTASPTIGPS